MVGAELYLTLDTVVYLDVCPQSSHTSIESISTIVRLDRYANVEQTLWLLVMVRLADSFSSYVK